MKKRIYRTTPVNAFHACTVRREDIGTKLVVAVDVAKVDMVAAFASADRRVLTTVRWKAPTENLALPAILRHFRSAEVPVEVVMEPSGTYGDVLRHQLLADGFPVFMVSGKRTFDAKEVYDGVPSLHDAKSAAIIARLHFDGISKPFRPLSPDRRQLRAAFAVMDLHQQRYLQLLGQLESWLARHWPELPNCIDLTSASLMALLARIGGPADVAAHRDQAARLLHGHSHGLLAQETITAVLDSAVSSVGLPLVGLERNALMAIAAEAQGAVEAASTGVLGATGGSRSPGTDSLAGTAGSVELGGTGDSCGSTASVGGMAGAKGGLGGASGGGGTTASSDSRASGSGSDGMDGTAEDGGSTRTGGSPGTSGSGGSPGPPGNPLVNGGSSPGSGGNSPGSGSNPLPSRGGNQGVVGNAPSSGGVPPAGSGGDPPDKGGLADRCRWQPAGQRR